MASIATNPDGTYTAEFALWEARQAARATALEVRSLVGMLRAIAPGNAAGAPADLVVYLARRRTDTLAVRLVADYEKAREEALGAWTALAELDPSVDVRPLLAD